MARNGLTLLHISGLLACQGLKAVSVQCRRYLDFQPRNKAWKIPCALLFILPGQGQGSPSLAWQSWNCAFPLSCPTPPSIQPVCWSRACPVFLMWCHLTCCRTDWGYTLSYGQYQDYYGAVLPLISAAEGLCWECRDIPSRFWQSLYFFSLTVHTQLEIFLLLVGWSALVCAAFNPLGPWTSVCPTLNKRMEMSYQIIKYAARGI